MTSNTHTWIDHYESRLCKSDLERALLKCTIVMLQQEPSNHNLAHLLYGTNGAVCQHTANFSAEKDP